MTLDKTQLKNDLKDLYNDSKIDPGIDSDDFAENMATIIDDYVKTALVTVTGVQSGGSNATGALT